MHRSAARTTAPRMPAPLIHVLVLSVLTTLTNASALAPATFGGASVTISLATVTLMVAGFEHVVRNRMRLRVPVGAETARDRDVLRIHAWGCALAAVVSVTCALYAALAW